MWLNLGLDAAAYADAPEQLIEPDPRQRAFDHQGWVVSAILCVRRWLGRVNSVVMSPLRVKSKMVPAAPQLNDIQLMWIMREAG